MKHLLTWMIPIITGLILLSGSCDNPLNNGSNQDNPNSSETEVKIDISGKVFDGPVYQAKIKAFNRQGELLGESLSDTAGNYRLKDIPGDVYTITAENGLDLGPDGIPNTMDDFALDITLRTKYSSPDNADITPLTTIESVRSEEIKLSRGTGAGEESQNIAVMSAVRVLVATGLSRDEAIQAVADSIPAGNETFVVTGTFEISDRALSKSTSRVHPSVRHAANAVLKMPFYSLDSDAQTSQRQAANMIAGVIADIAREATDGELPYVTGLTSQTSVDNLAKDLKLHGGQNDGRDFRSCVNELREKIKQGRVDTDSDLPRGTISFDNHDPVAVVGADRFAAIGAEVVLDGSRSNDPDGEPLRFSWVLLSQPGTSRAVLSDTSSAVVSFTPDTMGTYKIRLEVRDENSVSRADVMVTAKNGVVKSQWKKMNPSADWKARDGHEAIVFNDRMWIMGGIDETDSVIGDIWFSSGGTDWRKVEPEWPARSGLKAVVFNDEIWLAGGEGNYFLLSDIWRSGDGIRWSPVTNDAAWGARADHALAAFDGKLWLLGGDNGGKLNDVWSSSDGVDWTRVTAEAPWSARSHHTATVHQDRLWMIGGVDGRGNPLDDVWSTSDGLSWSKVKTLGGIAARRAHSTVVYNGRLTLTGGLDSEGLPLDQSRTSFDGSRWRAVTAKGEHPVRYKHAALAFKGYLRLFGGNDGNRLNNDIWIFRDGVTPSLTADAGDYQTVNVGAAVTLDGSGSNAGGADGMRYLWSFLTKPENSHARLKDHDTATPYFTPDVTGDYHILVTIIDPDGQTASDTVIITAVFSRQGRWIDSGGLDPHASGNPVVVIRSRSEQPVTIDLLSRSVNTSLIVMDETGEILTTATDMTRLNSGIRLTLPPGRYSVIPATLYRHRTGDFTLNIGGADLESVPVPTYRAASVGLFNTSGTSGKIEGTLTILKSLSETDIRDYLIYWGRDRNTKIDNSPFIAGLTVTGTDREFLFADPTTVPENASHLLVYSGNEQGEMPLPMSVRIGGGVFPTKIEAGSNHSCALLSSGELKCWGTGSRGQLGTGYATRLSTPVKAKTTDLMVGMTTGDSFTCAVNDKKQVDCWGRGADGRLGNGSQDDEFSPERIDSLSDIAQVTAGTFHACAVSESGHVDCWGDNNQGQLGTGDTTGHLTPVAVAGLPAVRQVSAGGFHTCALHRDGHVSCWGYGEDGQLGNNERRNQYRPVTVSGITDAVAISSGWAHNCAVLEGGSIKCWGRGSGGQLGRGSLENAETAVGVSGLSNAVEVSAGWAHTCARLRSGAVYCWGDGGYGQLGNGGLSDSVLPTPVSGINDAVQLSVGDLHTCAILSDGTAECWGYGAEGRLGDGGTQTQRVPQPVSGL